MNIIRPAWQILPLCVASALAVLAGCQMRGDLRPLSSEVPPPPNLVEAPARCTAARARFALGQRVTQPLMEEMRMRTGSRSARTALPEETVTPFASDRLIVDIEPNGRIVATRCT